MAKETKPSALSTIAPAAASIPFRQVLYAVSVILVLAFLNILPILWKGVSHADDLDIHLSYFQAFLNELGTGDLYPRWLSTLNGGQGSPMFLAQYPLPYYFLLVVYWPIHVLTRVDVPSAAPALMVVTLFILMASSGWAAYQWLKSWCSPAAALFGALLYLFAPYHFGLDGYRRYALGELVAYSLIPIVLLYTRRLVTERRSRTHFVILAFLFAALICSHPITAVMLVPLIFVEAILAGPASSARKPISGVCAGLIAGTLLSSFYVFPFIAGYRNVIAHPLYKRNYSYDDNYLKIPLDSIQSSMQRRRIPPPLEQAVNRSLALLGPAFTRKGKYSGFAPLVSLIDDLLMMLAGLTCLFLTGALWRDRTAGVWLAIGILSIFVQFYPSHWIADALSPLKAIQFPWRFSTVTCIALAAVGARAWEHIRARRPAHSHAVRHAGLAATMFVLLGCGNLVALSVSDFHEQRTVTGVDLEMYPLYTGRTFHAWGARQSPLELVSSRLQSAGRAWRVARGRARTFLVHTDAADADTVKINLVCFPGWSAVDLKSQKPLPIGCDKATGMASIDLPKGTTEIKMYFPLQPADYIGRSVSLIWAIFLLSFAVAAAKFRDSSSPTRASARCPAG
jgi:hypothetical protein